MNCQMSQKSAIKKEQMVEYHFEIVLADRRVVFRFALCCVKTNIEHALAIRAIQVSLSCSLKGLII